MSYSGLKIKFVAGGADHALPELAPETTVRAVKEILLAAGKGGESTQKQRVIYKGKILKDEETLGSHGMKSGETMILQITKGPAAPSSPAAVPAPQPAEEENDDDIYGDTPAAASLAGPAEMLAAISSLVAGNDVPSTRVGLETLSKVIDKIVSNPTEAKYRTLKQGNAVFARKLGALTGGRACMLAAGFTEDAAEGNYVLEASESAWEHLNACHAAVTARIATLPAPAQAAPAPVVAPAPAFGASPFGGMGGLGGMPPGGGMGGFGGMQPGMPPGMGDPAMMQQMMSDPMVQQMMSNPAMMQQMMQHPMVQQMMGSDPAMAERMRHVMSNPEQLQQAMQMMNNPGVQQMMQSPQMQQQMQQMMGGHGGMGGFPPAPAYPVAPGAPGGAPATPAAPAAPVAPSSTGSGGEAKTEEELIAEAIARSMEEK